MADPKLNIDGTFREDPPLPYKGDNYLLVQAGQVLIRGQRITVDGVTYEVASVTDGEGAEWPDERWELTE